MKAEKSYFKDIDSDICYPLSYHLEVAKEDGLKEISLVEAIPDTSNHEFVWCHIVSATSEKSECNKSCSDYKPVRGKGCSNKGKLFEHGKLATFNIK